MIVNICRFCGIKLHYKEDDTGWVENDQPNCLKNPTGPTYGHQTNSNDIERSKLCQ